MFSTVLCDLKSFYMLGNSWFYKLKKDKVLSLSPSLIICFCHTHTHTHTHTHNDMMDKMLKYKVFGDASLRGGNDLLTFMNKLESLNSAVSNSILLTMLLPQFPKCTAPPSRIPQALLLPIWPFLAQEMISSTMRDADCEEEKGGNS